MHEEPGTKEIVALREIILEGWKEIGIGSDIKEVAIKLCENDHGDPDQLVMGYDNQHLMVAGVSKQRTCLQFPIRPLWTHYINDARSAIEIVRRLDLGRNKNTEIE